jgi:hypothetical protein
MQLLPFASKLQSFEVIPRQPPVEPLNFSATNWRSLISMLPATIRSLRILQLDHLIELVGTDKRPKALLTAPHQLLQLELASHGPNDSNLLAIGSLLPNLRSLKSSQTEPESQLPIAASRLPTSLEYLAIPFQRALGFFYLLNSAYDRKTLLVHLLQLILKTFLLLSSPFLFRNSNS